jgi:hypothetical protein
MPSAADQINGSGLSRATESKLVGQRRFPPPWSQAALRLVLMVSSANAIKSPEQRGEDNNT